MKVRATWEFEVDEKDFDPKFVDVEGLAIDLAKKELEYLLSHNEYELEAEDFEYEVVDEWVFRKNTALHVLRDISTRATPSHDIFGNETLSIDRSEFEAVRKKWTEKED